MCMKYRAICFDFDYTLGDSTDSIVAGFQYGFTRLGWPAPDRETVRRTVGYLLEDAYTLLTGDRDPEHPIDTYEGDVIEVIKSPCEGCLFYHGSNPLIYSNTAIAKIIKDTDFI